MTMDLLIEVWMLIVFIVVGTWFLLGEIKRYRVRIEQRKFLEYVLKTDREHEARKEPVHGIDY